MIGLLQRHLTSQIDDQLIATAHTIQISASSATFAADGQGAIPTLYYVHIHDADGQDRYLYSEDTLKASGTPILPELIDTSSAPISSFRTLPVTVPSSKTGLGWRALVVPVYDQDTGLFSGYMTIALPLSDVQHTLRTTASYFTVAGLIIVIIGGWAGHVLVRRALLPLRSIESTAGKIAAGDLTKRLTPHPPTTKSAPCPSHSTLCSPRSSNPSRHVRPRNERSNASSPTPPTSCAPLWQRSPDTASCTQWAACLPNASTKSWAASAQSLPAWPPWSRPPHSRPAR